MMQPTPVARRNLLLRLAIAITALVGTIATAQAQPVCGGSDLMPGLAKSNPALHAQVLEVARSEPNSEAILWRIEKTGAASTNAAKPSWLFGTIHLTDPRVHVLSPAIREALDAATALALEIADVGPKAMQKAFREQPAILRPRDGQRLDTVLSVPERHAFATASQKIGVPLAQSQSMRPWFLTTLLSRPACEVARQEVAPASSAWNRSASKSPPWVA
jgi:uncharacterized protein